MTDDYLGIDIDKMEAYCGKLTWKIRPDGHVKPTTDKLKDAVAEYETVMKKQLEGKSTEAERLTTYEKASRTVLETALIGFDYDKAASDPEAGPALLGQLAGELKDFLVVQGGKAGRLRLLTQLKLIGYNKSNTSKDSKKS